VYSAKKLSLETGGAELTVPAMGSDHAIGGHRTFKSTGTLYFCQS